MASFCQEELTNAKSSGDTWTDFLENVKGNAAKQNIKIKYW